MAARHILVVDDEPEIRNLVRDILEDEGYAVDVAEHARQANEIKARFVPDLVLLDIWMPEMDGVSLLKQWNESNQLDCPVVMMSGHGTVETAVEATRLGAGDGVWSCVVRPVIDAWYAFPSVAVTAHCGVEWRHRAAAGTSDWR